MSFTDAEKVDIRRYCGFPLMGGQPVQAFGHRFFQQYGTLEFRLNNMQAAEEAVVRNTYLSAIALLEADLATLRNSLDTAEAAVWKRNPREQQEREALFRRWCLRLCAFLGLEPGPGLAAGLEWVV
jgi:hypothetical protein